MKDFGKEFGKSINKLVRKMKTNIKEGDLNKKNTKKPMLCPRCGSASMTSAAFYKPSIWMCFDCSYEGVAIIEVNDPPENIQSTIKSDEIAMSESETYPSNEENPTKNLRGRSRPTILLREIKDAQSSLCQ